MAKGSHDGQRDKSKIDVIKSAGRKDKGKSRLIDEGQASRSYEESSAEDVHSNVKRKDGDVNSAARDAGQETILHKKKKKRKLDEKEQDRTNTEEQEKKARKEERRRLREEKRVRHEERQARRERRARRRVEKAKKKELKRIAKSGEKEQEEHSEEQVDGERQDKGSALPPRHEVHIQAQSLYESPSTPAASHKEKKTMKRRLRADQMIDAVQSNDTSGLSSASASRAGASSTSRRRPADKLSEGKVKLGNKKHDKDALLYDAAGLTHEQLLIERVYEWKQLSILAEAIGLEFKKGKFSNWEEDQIDDILKEVQNEQGWNEGDGKLQELFSKKRTAEEHKIFTELFERMARRLPGRPNRAIRMLVRRKFSENAHRGPWTDAEQGALEEAVKKFGTNWDAVAKTVQRSNEDCRLRWRDFHNQLYLRLGHWDAEEDEALRKAVADVQRKQREDEADADATPSWSLVSKAMKTRSRMQCIDRWHFLHNPSPRIERKWSYSDDDEFVKRLSRKRTALQKNDFTLIDLDAITKDWVPWPRLTLLRAWRTLVDVHVRGRKRKRSRPSGDVTDAESGAEGNETEQREPRFDYGKNFKVNLTAIKSGLDERASRIFARRKNEEVDLIESDEEM